MALIFDFNHPLPLSPTSMDNSNNSNNMSMTASLSESLGLGSSPAVTGGDSHSQSSSLAVPPTTNQQQQQLHPSKSEPTILVNQVANLSGLSLNDDNDDVIIGQTRDLINDEQSDDDDETLTAATSSVKTMLASVADERSAFTTPNTTMQQGGPSSANSLLMASAVNSGMNLLPSGVLTPSPSTASGRVTTSPLRVSQSQVTCSMCLKQFDRRERRPKLLDCVHTVCSVCLEDYNHRNPAPTLPGSIGGQQLQQTTCPLCQRNTPAPVDKLPLDVVTLAMSENLTLFSRRNCMSCDASSEQIGDQETTLLYWDSACGFLICQPCYDAHVHDSAPNSHKAGSLIAVPSRISDEFYRQIRDMRNAPCPLHNTEMLNQYCFECNAFVCPDCVASHQRHHLVREQLDFAAQFGVESDFYRIYIENLKPFLRNLDQMWPVLQDRASQLERFVDGYENQAKELFNHILDRLNQYKQQTIEAVQRIREDREAQLRQDEERLAALILTGDRLIQWMMQSIDFCNTVELAAARQFVTNAYQQLFAGLDGFSRTSTMPVDVVQLPRLELFESAVLNILASAENTIAPYQVVSNATASAAANVMAGMAGSPRMAGDQDQGDQSHQQRQQQLFQQQQQRRASFSSNGQQPNTSGTPVVSVLQSRSSLLHQAGAGGHPLGQFAHQQSSMLSAGPVPNAFFGPVSTPSGGSTMTIASSPSPMQHPASALSVPLTPSGPGSANASSNVSFLQGMIIPSPNNQAPMILREPSAAQRIPRQRMIYHLKFGEFGVMEGQFTEPSGIACNAQNDIIVADTNNHRVQIFDSEGRFKFTYGECGKRDAQLLYPNRVAVCKATGDIVVTERSPSHQVQIYDQYGIFVRRFGQDCLKHPRGVFVDSRGRILVVECKVMRVTIFSMEGRVLRSFTCRSYLEFPNGICATDNPEEIYISDNRAHCVWVFNYEGIFLRRIGGEGITNYPIGVGINQLGEIVVADNHNNFNLTAFTPDGQVLYGLESKVKHAQVFDATLMNDGCVAIACKDYRVYVYRYMSASTRHLGLNIR